MGTARTAVKAVPKTKAEVVARAISDPIGGSIKHQRRPLSAVKDAPDTVWSRCVKAAIPHVKSIAQGRIEVARLAIEATHTEGNGEGRAKKYSLKRFAEEVGLKHKTLYDWVSVYSHVASKLPESTYDGREYEAARRVRDQVELTATPAQVAKVYQAEIESDPERVQVLCGLKRLRTLHKHICGKSRRYLADLRRQEPEALNEIAVLCEALAKRIRGTA